MANTNEKAVTVNEGATYEHNDSKDRVVAFFVDRPRSQVRFARLGSGREENTDIESFLKDYTLIAQQGELLPEDKKANDEAMKNKKDAPATSTLRERNEGARAERADAIHTARTTRR